jgi:predicted RNA binding protein YcfA (HicA-like mRNA interferase family)
MGTSLPVLSAKEVLRALAKAGFFVHHVTCSHYILKRDDKRVTVPFHRGDVRRGTLASIIKQSGLTVEEFLEYL